MIGLAVEVYIMHSKRWLLTSIIVVFSNDEQPLGDSLFRLLMYWTDKNDAFWYVWES